MKINWQKVRFDDESDEFDRVTSELSKGKSDSHWDMTFNQLKSNYSKSKLELLSENIWRNLGNTDSYKTDTIKKINAAIRANSSSGHRDIYKVLNEILTGKPRAPIILKFSQREKFTLIAGNTRLMGCKLIGIQPKVVIIRL